MVDEPWLAEYERALAQTTRKDETALLARIERLEEELEKLRERLNGLDSSLRS